MTERETIWILHALAQWLQSPAQPVACPRELSPDVIGEYLEKNRLLPLFHSMSIQFPASTDWDRLRERIDHAYPRSLLQGLQHLNTGHHMMDCLSMAGIKSRAVRGPFLAEDIYGDPALRLSSDIDILISCRDRRRAWRACQAAGYRSLDGECPLWPVDKHRIHWRLQREGDPVVCELHWAVEPVYGVMTLDYEALVRDSTPTQQFLLLCLHAGGHVFERLGETPSCEDLIREGMLFRWLDVAMFLRKYGAAINWDGLGSCARDRRVSSSIVLCLQGVREGLGVALPDPAIKLLPDWENSMRKQRSMGFRQQLEARWARRTGRFGGLQTPLPDVLYYLFPLPVFFTPSCGGALLVKRVRHFLVATGLLSGAFISFTVFALINSIRKYAMTARVSCIRDNVFIKVGDRL